MIAPGLMVMAAGAQLADVVTYLANDEGEANPVVNALGAGAVPAKLALLLTLFVLWAVAVDAATPPRTSYAVKLALCLAIAVGVVGTVSNVL